MGDKSERRAKNGLRVGDWCWVPTRGAEGVRYSTDGFHIAKRRVLGVNPNGTMVAVSLTFVSEWDKRKGKVGKPHYDHFARLATDADVYVPNTFEPNLRYDIGDKTAYASLADVLQAMQTAVALAVEREDRRRSEWTAWRDETIATLELIAEYPSIYAAESE